MTEKELSPRATRVLMAAVLIAMLAGSTTFRRELETVHAQDGQPSPIVVADIYSGSLNGDHILNPDVQTDSLLELLNEQLAQHHDELFAFFGNDTEITRLALGILYSYAGHGQFVTNTLTDFAAATGIEQDVIFEPLNDDLGGVRVIRESEDAIIVRLSVDMDTLADSVIALKEQYPELRVVSLSFHSGGVGVRITRNPQQEVASEYQDVEGGHYSSQIDADGNETFVFVPDGYHILQLFDGTIVLEESDPEELPQQEVLAREVSEDYEPNGNEEVQSMVDHDRIEHFFLVPAGYRLRGRYVYDNQNALVEIRPTISRIPEQISVEDVIVIPASEYYDPTYTYSYQPVGAYRGPDASVNLELMYRFAERLQAEGISVVSAGGNDAENLDSARRRIDRPQPTTLFLVGEWDSARRAPEAGLIGADMYVDNVNIIDAESHGSSLSTPIIADALNQLIFIRPDLSSAELFQMLQEYCLKRSYGGRRLPGYVFDPDGFANLKRKLEREK